MELYNIIVSQGCQRLVIAEGMTLEETTELLVILNKSKPPRTHYLRSRTPMKRVVELLTTERVTVDW